jgi:hypothetical protein
MNEIINDSQSKPINETLKRIRITIEKPVIGGIEKREVVITGYKEMLLIVLLLFIALALLLLLGIKF